MSNSLSQYRVKKEKSEFIIKYIVHVLWQLCKLIKVWNITPMTLQMKIDYKMAKKEDTLISNSIMMYSVKQMVKNKPIIFLLDIKMKRATTVFYI